MALNSGVARRAAMALSGAAVAVALAGGFAATASAQQCTATDGAPVVNDLFTALTPVLNAAWPAASKAAGIDPLVVGKLKVDIPCKYAGTELCAAQAGKCDWMKLYLNVNSITGLSYLQFSNIVMQSLTATVGNKECKFAKKPFNNSCSFQGTASGAAALSGGDIVINAKDVELRLRCTYGGVFPADESKVWPNSGKATIKCTANKVKGSASMPTCAGLCASGSPASAIEGMEVSDLVIKNDDLKCDVKPDYSPVSWIAEALIPELEEKLISAVTPPIEKALTGVLNDYIPYPTTSCP